MRAKRVGGTKDRRLGGVQYHLRTRTYQTHRPGVQPHPDLASITALNSPPFYIHFSNSLEGCVCVNVWEGLLPNLPPKP